MRVPNPNSTQHPKQILSVKFISLVKFSVTVQNVREVRKRSAWHKAARKAFGGRDHTWEIYQKLMNTTDLREKMNKCENQICEL